MSFFLMVILQVCVMVSGVILSCQVNLCIGGSLNLMDNFLDCIVVCRDCISIMYLDFEIFVKLGG